MDPNNGQGGVGGDDQNQPQQPAGDQGGMSTPPAGGMPEPGAPAGGTDAPGTPADDQNSGGTGGDMGGGSQPGM